MAIVESADEFQKTSLLRLISADGRSYITVSNTQRISGRDIVGQFEWFNHTGAFSLNILGIVFRPEEGSEAYLMRIDAATGNAVSVDYIRA